MVVLAKLVCWNFVVCWGRAGREGKGRGIGASEIEKLKGGCIESVKIEGQVVKREGEESSFEEGNSGMRLSTGSCKDSSSRNAFKYRNIDLNKAPPSWDTDDGSCGIGTGESPPFRGVRHRPELNKWSQRFDPHRRNERYGWELMKHRRRLPVPTMWASSTPRRKYLTILRIHRSNSNCSLSHRSCHGRVSPHL